MQAVGQAHAKIILIGEHAVVYGQPAICLPLLTVKNQAFLQSISAGQLIKSRYFTGDLAQAGSELNGIKQLIDALLIFFNAEANSFELTITSEIPAERGMGSSAATAIAVIRAFYAYFQTELSEAKLLSWADLSEQIIHTNPSGLDATAASVAQPLWYQKGQPFRTLPLDLPGYLLIADSGIHGRTSEAVSAVKQLLVSRPQTKQVLAELGQLTHQTALAIQTKNLNQLGQILTAAQKDLRQLTVSDSRLDSLIELAVANGSLGSKLTGGGRGGCFISLLDLKSSAEQLNMKLLAAGVTQTWIEPLMRLS